MTLASLLATSAVAMEVTLWGGKNARTAYETQLLQAVLDHTADQYPAYRLSVNNQHLGAQRGRQAVADGELANVYVSGLRDDDFTRAGRLLVVPHPTMKGLLGYRAAIIRKADQQRFAKAAAQHQLRNLTVGQGSHWADADILRHNAFSVNDSGRYENLLEMLAYGRFDTVFLGIAEAADEIAASRAAEQLTVAEHTLIYYPHAMVFYVSARERELAERIALGLKRVEEDGTLDALLHHHFGDAIALIRRSDTQLLVLEHPSPSLVPALEKPLLATSPKR